MLLIISLASLLLLFLIHRIYSYFPKKESTPNFDIKEENVNKTFLPPDDNDENAKKKKPAALMSNGICSRKRSSGELYDFDPNGSSLPPSPGPDSLLSRLYEFGALIRNADIAALPGASYGSYVFTLFLG